MTPEQAYNQGFMDKCAECEVDPVELLKFAQSAKMIPKIRQILARQARIGSSPRFMELLDDSAEGVRRFIRNSVGSTDDVIRSSRKTGIAERIYDLAEAQDDAWNPLKGILQRLGITKKPADVERMFELLNNKPGKIETGFVGSYRHRPKL